MNTTVNVSNPAEVPTKGILCVTERIDRAHWDSGWPDRYYTDIEIANPDGSGSTIHYYLDGHGHLDKFKVNFTDEELRATVDALVNRGLASFHARMTKEANEIVKGDRVKNVRGRKCPKGTFGTVLDVAEKSDSYTGAKFRELFVKLENGNYIHSKLRNWDRATTVVVTEQEARTKLEEVCYRSYQAVKQFHNITTEACA